MKKLIGLTILAVTSFALPSYGQLLLTGVFDGPLSSGYPKGVEVYASQSIADLSIYGLGSANNGGGSGGQEFTFSGSASAGDFIYVGYEAPLGTTVEFNNWFGFSPDFTASAVNINGDDAIELFKNGSVIDVFGEINLDGSGKNWEYLDSWAYRNNGTGPDGTTFVESSWSFGGPNALDGETSNASAAVPIPVGSYTGAAIPEPSTYALIFGGLALGLVVWRKRRS